MPENEWKGADRRVNSRNLEEVEAAFDRKLRDHEDCEEERIRTLIARFSEEAFPDGPEKHRDYHQAKINSAREEAEFWKAAKMEMAKAGVSTLAGVIKIILGLAFVGLMFKLGLGAFVTGAVK